jgi:sugar lactone lactonase YvrE
MRKHLMSWIRVSVVGLSAVLWAGAMRAQTVTTLAGVAGSHGAGNGEGNLATFYKPNGIAVDSAGNVYVADTWNNMIRKITPGGSVSTLAGSGIAGSGNGQGTGASFSSPQGVAVDAAGNVYVADPGNRSIRKITASGYVTTLASGGNLLLEPTQLALDASGRTLYVTEDLQCDILTVSTSTGAVSRFAGIGSGSDFDGPALSASFFGPSGVAVGSSGQVYVADRWGNSIRGIYGGIVYTIAGSGSPGSANGFGKAASFHLPEQIAVDAAGNLYVTDWVNNMIRIIAPNSSVATFAGIGAVVGGHEDGPGFAATFNTPGGVAVDSAGNVYVADTGNNVIRKILPALTQTGTTLPLVGGRFVVTLNYATYPPNPLTGQGTGWRLTDNVGYFGTTDPTASDVTVKMINFCSLNNSWSVYIGGTTDINTTISIQDTQTGRYSQSFVNPLGTPFQLIRSQAFSCP